MEELRPLLSPYYLEVKTLHLLAVGVWSFSTAVAFRDYLVPAFRAWFNNPHNSECIAERNIAMERFDRGAQLEHWAFPIVLLTGIALVWMAGWPVEQVNWLSVKLGLIILVFVPMEFADYYISHFGGNKANIRQSGNDQRYEVMTLLHWRFLQLSVPIVLTLIPLTYYLAVTKPF